MRHCIVKKGSQPVCCFECSSELMSSPILSVFLCNSWYYVQMQICPAVTRYFTKTFAKLGYNHHHHRLISGKDWKQSVGVCWKRTQHAEKEVRVSLCGMSYLEWNSSAAFWVKRLRLTKKNVAKTASQRKACKIQPVRHSRTDGPSFCLFAERKDSHRL